MKRKSGKIQEFLATYCSRGRDEGPDAAGAGNVQGQSKGKRSSQKLRNIVNVDKVLEDELVAP